MINHDYGKLVDSKPGNDECASLYSWEGPSWLPVKKHTYKRMHMLEWQQVKIKQTNIWFK